MKKKIAFISEPESPMAALGGVDAGGQNVYVGELAKQLAAAGHLVDIFTRREDPLLQRCIEWSDSIRIVHLDAGPATVLPKETLLPAKQRFSLLVSLYNHSLSCNTDSCNTACKE